MKFEQTRRGLLFGGAAVLLAAPAIVRVASLMPISVARVEALPFDRQAMVDALLVAHRKRHGYFNVVCDHTNNSPEDIAAGRVNIVFTPV